YNMCHHFGGGCVNDWLLVSYRSMSVNREYAVNLRRMLRLATHGAPKVAVLITAPPFDKGAQGNVDR
ncbi:hypothetical protein Q2354_27480, partial [Escherichia coli]|nr:hypothetical protein [Escherichia coli]